MQETVMIFTFFLFAAFGVIAVLVFFLEALDML